MADLTPDSFLTGLPSQPDVREVHDDYIEIPLFSDNDGEPYLGLTLKVRAGSRDGRAKLEMGSVGYEVQSAGLYRALRLLDEQR